MSRHVEAVVCHIAETVHRRNKHQQMPWCNRGWPGCARLCHLLLMFRHNLVCMVLKHLLRSCIRAICSSINGIVCWSNRIPPFSRNCCGAGKTRCAAVRCTDMGAAPSPNSLPLLLTPFDLERVSGMQWFGRTIAAQHVVRRCGRRCAVANDLAICLENFALQAGRR